MKYFLIFLIVLASCRETTKISRDKISLAGEWQFRIDPLDTGIVSKWYNENFNEAVNLPGSMAENGKGDEVTVETDWTGSIVDRSYFTDDKYEKYRQPGNIKVPFWLQPVKYFKGVAWYGKEVVIPDTWDGKRIILFLERCHWQSDVYVNGKMAGKQMSLSTPNEYDITDHIVKGRNRIAVRIDNRVIVPVGVNSHSISDHTQGNWNGIAGEISLHAMPPVFISDIRIYPDIQEKKAKVIVEVSNPSGNEFTGKLAVRAAGFNSDIKHSAPRKSIKVKSVSGRMELVFDYPMGNRVQQWSEFTPSLYRLTATLSGPGIQTDIREADFGMREFKTNGTRFEINGHPLFLRGTTECCIFPLTGYPPSDVDYWLKILKACKDYGLNHMRFHSYCPPEAAFAAADKLGIYFHVECSSWANQGSSIGNGAPIDKFIYEEGDRILKAYGNHPSFCMMAYGNEPAGRNQNAYLGSLLNYWKAKDTRRVYTSAAGWPVIPENEYNVIPAPRIQQWGQGLKSIINAEPPQTMYDFGDIISKYDVPVVGHEIGQWCVYPDFKEIEKYTGPLKASNFEIFRETLTDNAMGEQAEDFLLASGKLQVLCYKADIEAALRTPGYAGFEILQLHDFPGQGTALVGILNPFFESKGYVTPAEFRNFCNSTVPLARMKKLIYSNSETFNADIEVSHFGSEPFKKATVISRIKNAAGLTVSSVSYSLDEIPVDNCIPAGTISFDLSRIVDAQKLTLEVTIQNTEFRNMWDFWVYPETPPPDPGDVLITEILDQKAVEVLSSGGKVLYLPFGKIGKSKGAQVAIGFSSIFWNTAWTNNQAPHTLGILCNPDHTLFKSFPTEYHINWQWWDLVAHSQVMVIDGFPPELKPLIQPIDTWFENRRLALAFEAKVNAGKLMVCSIDMKELSGSRLVSKQLLESILTYMNSDSFNPSTGLNVSALKDLISN